MDGKKVVENVSILQLVKAFVDHRKEVLTNKFTAEHLKNSSRIHILEGLLGITDKIDAVIKLVRNADNKEEAAKELIAQEFVSSQEQADAVLRITLGNLTKLDTRALVLLCARLAILLLIYPAPIFDHLCKMVTVL